MGDLNVQQRKFVVKAGMTVDDVKNSKEATVLQKKYASAFDTDGTKGFSQKEADLFNATSFAEKADGTVTFWTRQKDGTKKGTKFNSNDNNIQFKSEDEVKPYVKQVVVKKAAQKKEESVSFFDEKWSGHQISRLTGDNAITDWLQDKDKVCTDGKDDGKIGFWEGTKSLVKGVVGGIPKAIINHPIATIATIGVCAAATALTGGAILPVLGAIGVATGVGMAGYGGYKALTAKTDGEAKQALETLGMGLTTTALSVAAADKALEKAAEAGVKSAQVSEDAGVIDKTIQMFKAIPEALKVSGKNAYTNIRNLSLEGSFVGEKNILESHKKSINRKINKISKSLPKDQQATLKKYLSMETRQQILDSITEENAELAEKLYSVKNAWGNYNYTKNTEEMCEYYFRIVPEILKSDNPQLKQVALQIFDKPISQYYRYKALSALVDNNNVELLQNELTSKQAQIIDLGKPHIIIQKNTPTYSCAKEDGAYFYKFYDEDMGSLKFLKLREQIPQEEVYGVYQQIKAGKYNDYNVIDQSDYQPSIWAKSKFYQIKDFITRTFHMHND